MAREFPAAVQQVMTIYKVSSPVIHSIMHP